MRNELKEMILSIEDNNPKEIDDINDVVKWIDSDVKIYREAKPNTPNKHLSTFFVVINKDKNKIVLVHHKLAKAWVPAGGHVEIDEDPLVTVSREAKEELGIEAEFVTEKPIFLNSKEVGENHIDVNLWFALIYDENKYMKYDDLEFHDVRWFDFDNLPENSEINLPRFLEKLGKYF